jgi:hypothetical protein
MQVLRFRLFSLFVITVILWSIGGSLGRAQEQEQAKGELKLEGKHVERLVLWRKDGHTEMFDQPGEVVELPVGQYLLMESHLDGGYSCIQGTVPQNKWITIDENKPAVLKVGAPLKQTLEVKRQGRTLALDSKLLGIGGEGYAKANRSNPPSFTVYKGDQEIASGQLAYG